MQSTLFHRVHLLCADVLCLMSTILRAIEQSSQSMSICQPVLGQEHRCHVHPSSWLICCGCMQRYANKLGSCLLETSEDIDSPADRQLAKWVSEVTSLMVCMAQGNPKVALKHGLADFTSSTQVNQADPTHRQDAFFVDLLVSVLHLRLTTLQSHVIQTCFWQYANKATHRKPGSLVGHCGGPLSQRGTLQVPALDICC